MWTKKPENGDGYYLFKGTRRTPGKNFIVPISEPVKVKYEKAYHGIVIQYIGKGALFALSDHEGKWKYLSLEDKEEDS